MKVKWLGHACFLITSRDGLRIITDPYAVGGGINYSPIGDVADVVLVSHEHADHGNVSVVRGKPEVIRGSGKRTVKGIQFKGVATAHDASRGQERGLNTVFCFSLDNVKLCHLGDLGHVLSPAQVAEIEPVDILFVPVGGFFTIDASAAYQVCDQLKPRITIPMHFKTPKCAYPIAGVDEFLGGKENVRRIADSQVEFDSEDLPPASVIVLLQPAS